MITFSLREKTRSFSVHRLFALAVVATSALYLSGCETTSTKLPGQASTPRVVVLSAGDVLKFTFPGAPELNQTQKVRADGKLSLPLIGEVHASGKGVVEFQNELSTLFRSQLKNSDVLITVESNITNVVVSGAVAKPGKLQFDRPTTALQAIMEAGGANEYGNLKKVRLIRVVNGAERTQILNISRAFSGQATTPFYVQDGDIIYVPMSAF